MAVDKNLFLYDLALVAILKNEAPYVREWLDYHLLAGVDHFYIYDNESPDNLKDVLQPYIERGIVTYTFYPGNCRQMETYLDAVNRHKFFCRYMTIIDGDEFIFPKSNRSITEAVDEILAASPQASGLAMNWNMYGSNGYEKADYSRGVLERFTRRAETNWTPPIPALRNAPGGNAHVKTIANPRKIHVFHHSHAPQYFEGCFAINEKGILAPGGVTNYPPSSDKIVVNHYNTKSREEYAQKIQRGNADFVDNGYNMSKFVENDRNEVFDDGILKYRTARQLVTGGGIQPKPIDYLRLSNALIQNLFPATLVNSQPDFLAGKIETFLTCRKLATYLREKIFDRTFGNALEEAALRAVQKTLLTPLTLADVRLLLSEMPEILTLEYPVVQEIRQALIQLLPQIMVQFRLQNAWQQFRELEYTLNMLKAFDNYEHD